MNLVPLLGIVTVTMLIVTVASGLLGAKLWIHKSLAIITLAIALVHGGIVISKILLK